MDLIGGPRLETTRAVFPYELGTGNVLVAAEWDRASCSMMDGVHIIERITGAAR